MCRLPAQAQGGHVGHVQQVSPRRSSVGAPEAAEEVAAASRPAEVAAGDAGAAVVVSAVSEGAVGGVE